MEKSRKKTIKQEIQNHLTRLNINKIISNIVDTGLKDKIEAKISTLTGSLTPVTSDIYTTNRPIKSNGIGIKNNKIEVTTAKKRLTIITALKKL